MAKNPRVSPDESGGDLQITQSEGNHTSERVVNPLVESSLKKRMVLVKQIEASIDVLAKQVNALTEHDLSLYQLLYKPDSLYNDCPISKLITYHHIKNHMIKRDMDFIGYILDGKHSVKTFAEISSEIPKWANRFAYSPMKEKIGIEAIL